MASSPRPVSTERGPPIVARSISNLRAAKETAPAWKAEAFGTRFAVYFNELLIEVNLSLRLVPRPLTAAIMANEIPAAISPYSIAVAPDSSDKNFKKIRCNYASH